MEDFRHIDFPRLRDFSMKVNATFEFVKQNFKPLAKSILVIAGPPALIASLVIGNFMSDFMKFTTNMGTGNFGDLFLTVDFWVQMMLLLVFGILTYIFTIATINNYLILYSEKRTNQIEVPEVWARVRETFWMYFGTAIFLGILILAAYLVLIIPIVLLAAVSPFLIFFGVVFFIIAFMYLLFSVSLTFFIRGYEKKGFFESLSRSFYLVRGKWWSTFGLIVILSMIAGVISYIFMVPYYIATFSTLLHQTTPDTFAEPSSSLLLISKIFLTLYYLAQIMLSMIPNVGIAFQYFNLVELKEAKGLLSDIEKFGQASDPTANRPKEHY